MRMRMIDTSKPPELSARSFLLSKFAGLEEIKVFSMTKQFIWAFLAVTLILCASSPVVGVITSSSGEQTCSSVIDAHYPRQYVAYFSNETPIFDGNLDEPFWNEVPWTTDFVDISTITIPKLLTKAKIRWSNDWIYVGGYVQEPQVWANITYTCHCYNTSEDQVIFHDNDFEVFFDVDGTCHYYKEYEMNAANQNWDLLLNAPYENNGYENSTRVFGAHGFDMKPPLRSATYISGGVLNDPATHPKFWSVEIAFPVEKLVFHTTLQGTTPRNKQFWRINFSRVEWAVKVVNGKYEKFPSCQSCPVPGTPTCDNWVWSPMYVIDVHHPEMWGFLQFSDEPVNSTAPIYNQEWGPRYVAHELYYAQVNFAAANNNVYASDVAQLLAYANYNVTLNEECTGKITIWNSADNQQYVAMIPSLSQPFAITVTQDRYIAAHYFNGTTIEAVRAQRDALVQSLHVLRRS